MFINQTKRLAILVTLQSLSFNLHAQLEANLAEVEVIASKEALDKIPRQVLIIDRKEIERSAAQSLTELLEYAVGLDMRQRGAFDAQTDISMRGGTFDQTLILIDGIRMNDPQTGHHNLNLPISPQQIERIEILPGGSGHALGAGAMTGVINIVTRKNDGNMGNAEFFIGQNGMMGARIFQHIGNDKKGFSIHGQYMQHDGYIPNTDFQNAAVNLTGYRNTKNLEIQGMVGFVSRAFGAQNFYTFAFPEQFEAVRGINAQGSLQYHFPNKQTRLRINTYARQHHDRFELFREGEDFFIFQEGFFIRGNDTVPSWYNDHNFHRSRTAGVETYFKHQITSGHFLTLGLDYRYEAVRSNALGEFLDQSVDVAFHPRGQYTRFADRHNIATSLGYRGETGRWKLQAGVLANYNNDFGLDFLPGAEIGFETAKNQMLFAGVNHSFRLPTFTDLYYTVGGAQGSIDLKTEYSNQYEIGYRARAGKYTLQSAAFLRQGRELIDWIRFPGEPITQAANINQLDVYGFEGQFTLSTPNVNFLDRVAVGYTWLNSLQDDFEFVSFYALDFLRHKINASITGDMGGIVYHFRVSWQDRRGSFIPFGETDAVAYPQIWMSALRVSKEIKSLNVFVEASNLFNQQPIFDRGGIELPGLWVRGGFRVNW
jgi:vitamin B12 transporter